MSAYERGGREPSLATLSSPFEACGVTLPVEGCGPTLQVHLGELPTRGRPGAVVPVGRRLTRRRDEVLATPARHRMTDLRVFGSVARGEDTDDSVLVLLVHVPEGTGLLALGRFTQELEDLLHVRVDVVPHDSVKPRVRDSIRSDLVPL